MRKIDLENHENNKWYQVIAVLMIVKENYKERINFRKDFASFTRTKYNDQKPKYLKIIFIWFFNRKLCYEFLEYDCQNII